MQNPKEGGVREIFSIAIPMFASMASQTIMTFTDRMFLSWHSAQAIAASMPAGLLSFSFICFFMGTGGYAGTLIAQFYGAKKHEDLVRSLWQGIYFSVLAGLVIAMLVSPGRMIIEHSGHSADVIVEELAYFNILTYGGGITVLVVALSSYYTGRGDTRTVMYVSFAGAGVNIILDYIFIFGKLGFPGMGISGAGYATVAGGIVSAVIYLLLIFCGRESKIFPVRRLWKFNSRIFSKLVHYGLPGGFQFFLDILGFSVFIFLLGSYGDVALAASNIAVSVDMLAFMPLVSIGIATSVLVGQYIGMGKKHIAETVAANSLKIAICYGFFIGSMFYFFPEFFIGFFKGEDEKFFTATANQAVKLFRILPFYLLGDCFSIIYGNALGGAGDTRFKMFACLAFSSLLFIPGEILILKCWHLPLTAGWWWITVYLSAMGIAYFLRFKKGNWQKIDMIS